MPTLIIRDQLVCPPSWVLSIRDITLFMTVFCRADCVIASVDPDPYYRWLKNHGAMDFVRDFVRPGSEAGVWLDTKMIFPNTIPIDRIIPENQGMIIDRSRALLLLHP